MGNKKKKIKKKNRIKRFITFIIFEILFAMLTFLPILLYGPFTTAKRMFVGAAMSSAKHQYLAKWFLSDKEINKIINGDSVSASSSTSNEKINTSMINIKSDHSDKIEKSEISHARYNGYILVISDPTRVRIGCTNKFGKEGERTSQIAEDHKAVAAINGGGFTDNTGGSWGGTASLPTGILIVDGKVIHNTVSNDQKTSTIAFDSKGMMYVGKFNVNDLKKLNAKDALSFEIPNIPSILMLNGKSMISGDGGGGPAPRTAIGQKADGTIVMVVIDGRGASSVTKMGATLGDLVQIMKMQGVQNAMNLDGGSSATMYYDGEVINNPSDWSGERVVNNAVYVTP